MIDVLDQTLSACEKLTLVAERLVALFLARARTDIEILLWFSLTAQSLLGLFRQHVWLLSILLFIFYEHNVFVQAVCLSFRSLLKFGFWSSTPYQKDALGWRAIFRKL